MCHAHLAQLLKQHRQRELRMEGEVDFFLGTGTEVRGLPRDFASTRGWQVPRRTRYIPKIHYE